MTILVFVALISLVKGNPLANGAESLRIAGGAEVELKQYPFATVLLTSQGTITAFQQACGGTILTNNAILTAAACFWTDGQANPLIWWRARIGSVLSNRGGFLHLIRAVNAHPQFSATSRANDIAVIRTTVNMALQAGIIEGASIVGGAHTMTNQQPIVAIGWGIIITGGELSERLRAVQFWVVAYQTCAERYADLDVTLAGNVVCTGWLDVGVRGQCQGDAGSPILVEGAVVGVHSWAEGCAQGRYPGINTQVAPHSKWIVDTALA